jgi:membrane protease YdiL (CAAX protease family)
MNFSNFFINNKTGMLRSGWRALIFICIFLFLVQFAYFSLYNIITYGNNFRLDAISDVFLQGIISIVVVIPLSIWMVRSFDKISATSLVFNLDRKAIKNIIICFSISLLVSAVIIWSLISFKVISFTQIPDVPHTVYFYTMIFWLLLFVIIDVCGEELVLRGYLQQTLARGIGLFPSIIITALVFVFLKNMSFKNVNIIECINLMLMSIALSLAMFKSASIWVPCGLHIGWDLLQTLAGTKGFDYHISSIFYSISENPGIFYNKIYGMDGSISGLLGWLIIIPIIYFLPLGKSLKDHWWQFSDNIHSSKMRIWDFCVNNRDYYQWKFSGQEEDEDEE